MCRKQNNALFGPMCDTQNDRAGPRRLKHQGGACLALMLRLPCMPTWRGISCPGLEVATCWSTSHTCQCNGYDHWGRQVAMKMGMRKERKEGGRWCWRRNRGCVSKGWRRKRSQEWVEGKRGRRVREIQEKGLLPTKHHIGVGSKVGRNK